MQSYVIDNQPANILEEVADWWNNMVALHRGAMDRIITREPDDMLPRMLLLLWVLVGLTVIVCTTFGVAYHYSVFTDAAGSKVWGVVAAILFLIIVEITTVLLGLYFFDALLERLWWKSLKRFLLVALTGTIVFFAVDWSISISTKGVAAINKQIRTQEVYQNNQFALPPAVISIDSQLAKINQTIQTAKGSTWKGRPTGEGLEVIKENTQLQRDLMRQRELLLQSSISHQDSIRNNQLGGVAHTADLLSEYGGKAEYAKVICLFLIALIGAILRDKYREENPEPAPAESVGK